MFHGSLVALVTPMTDDGEVDFPCLRRLVDWHVESGSNGLVIAGTTGESATLERDEHVEVIRVAAEQAAGRLPVIAGTGSNSTRQTVDLSVAVSAAPIDGYLVVTPYYNKPTQQGLVAHFRAVADAVDRPVMLYNVPGRTAVDLLPETVAELSVHPRITCIKEATGEVDRVGRLRSLCGDDFGLFSGDDATAREFLLAGGQGVVSVTANVAPGQMASMCAAASPATRAQPSPATGRFRRCIATCSWKPIRSRSNGRSGRWAVSPAVSGCPCCRCRSNRRRSCRLRWARRAWDSVQAFDTVGCGNAGRSTVPDRLFF